MRAILLALFLFSAPPALAQGLTETDFSPLPLHEAMRIVGERYQGRLIAARLAQPNAHERGLGVELVEELRLLTPARNLLKIRLDARDGRFLEVAGRGQIEALKK
ncbi:PepSY domain-containing protein [Paracoccus zhejiangensis]|nr:Cys/Met metabolism pyridoxal-phosphate-dependent enzyme [Paracoccus zhejiangensis]